MKRLLLPGMEEGGSWLSSTVYQDEIYPVGWTNGMFYKYYPSTDQWTSLVIESKPAGTYEIDFDASALPSGVYFYKIKTRFYTDNKMMNFFR